MTILDRVAQSAILFRPQSYRQFLALNIARKFNDLPRLNRYLRACDVRLPSTILEIARAPAPDGKCLGDAFLDSLEMDGRREVL